MRARAVKPSSPIQESGRRLPRFGASCRVRRSLPAVKNVCHGLAKHQKNGR